MKLRDYIEKKAASKRQLRLAKKFIEEGTRARAFKSGGGLSSLPPQQYLPVSKKLSDTMQLGRMGMNIRDKHRLGREAAREFAKGNTGFAQDLVDLGKARSDFRKSQMRGFHSKNMQRKARKAFGKINK